MNPKSLDAIVLRYVGFAILFIGIAVMLYLVRGVLPVFAVGGLIAYALEPLLQRLETKGRSRAKAVAFVFGIYILLLLVLFSLLAAAVQQAQPLVQSNVLSVQFESVKNILQANQEKLQKLPVPSALRETINTTINTSTQNISNQIPTFARETSLKLVTATTSFLISVFLITIISFGLMLNSQDIKGRLLMMVPPVYRRDATRLSASINELLGRYVRGQLIVCGTFGALCTVAFEVLSRLYGMQYPLVLGAFAACIYVLPYFGLAAVFITSVLTAYLTATPGQNVQCAALTAGCCIVFNLFIDYGVAPRVLGRGVGLHPLMIIFALLCGFELGGPIGTIVAVPILASLRVILIYLFPQLVTPLPDETPASNSSTPHSGVTVVNSQVATAEANTPQEPLFTEPRKA